MLPATTNRKKGWNTLGHNMQLSFEERPTQPPTHPLRYASEQFVLRIYIGYYVAHYIDIIHNPL